MPDSARIQAHCQRNLPIIASVNTSGCLFGSGCVAELVEGELATKATDSEPVAIGAEGNIARGERAEILKGDGLGTGAREGIPETHRLSKACRGKGGAVGGEREACDPSAAMIQGVETCPREPIPDPNRGVV